MQSASTSFVQAVVVATDVILHPQGGCECSRWGVNGAAGGCECSRGRVVNGAAGGCECSRWVVNGAAGGCECSRG